MKRVYKYLFVFLGSLFMFPLVSNAECSYERQAELSKIASNVQFSYTYDVVEGEPQFDVVITNLTNDIYIKDENFDYYINGMGEKSIKYYMNGVNVQFDIYSNDTNCKDEKILTKYINLPSYNRYSDFSECAEQSQFKYCQIWSNTKTVTEAEFRKQAFEYNQLQNAKDKEDEFNYIEWLKNNKGYIICVMICILILVILAIVRRVKK